MTARLLWRLICFRPWLFALETGVWVGIFAVPLLTGLVLRGVFDSLLGTASPGFGVPTLIALLVGLEAAGVMITYARIHIENKIEFSTGTLLRANALDEVLHRPKEDHHPESAGELANRFRDDAGEIMGSIWWPAALIGQSMFAVVAAAIMVQIHALMTVVAMLPLLVVVVIAQLATARMQHYRHMSRGATGSVTGFLGDVFSSIQSIQVAGAESLVAAEFDTLNEERRRSATRDHVFERLIDSLWQNGSQLAVVAILLVAASAMRSGDFTVGEFALFIYYLEWMRTIPLVLGSLIARYRHAQVAFERLGNALGSTSSEALVAHRPLYLDRDPPHIEQTSGGSVATLERLDIRALSCRHASGHGIEDITLSLRAGSLTVIVGRVGAGKTTLLRVLLGLLAKASGEIRWNGKLVESAGDFFVPPRAVYVPQFPRLFSGSIRENVLLGIPEDDVDLAHALRSAVLDRDLAGMPDGLDTIVGPRGVRLSGGQIQRVAAARTFVRRAQLVVLDDVSSMLDAHTQAALWKSVRELRTTVLAVSHRHDVLEAADEIIVLRNGRIEASGMLSEVLRASREMQSLWEGNEDTALPKAA